MLLIHSYDMHTFIHTHAHSFQPYSSSVWGSLRLVPIIGDYFYSSLVWLFDTSLVYLVEVFLLSCHYLCVLKVWSKGNCRTIAGLVINGGGNEMCTVWMYVQNVDHVYFMHITMTNNHTRGQYRHIIVVLYHLRWNELEREQFVH